MEIRARRCLSCLAVALVVAVVVGPAIGAAAAPAAALPPVLSGCEYDYPPYCVVTGDSRADGFSVELLRAALRMMGREVAFKVGPWSVIKEDLAAGRLQVLPLVGRTPEREAEYDFTVPYLVMHGTIVARTGDTGIRTLADLRGRRVAVLRGDNAEEFMRRSKSGAAIVTTATYDVALQGLAAGEYDAVVIQKLLALQLIKRLGLNNLRPVGQPLAGFVQSFCFAVRDGDRELLGLVNEGLAIVMADGTFQRLYTKWFAPIEEAGRSRIIVGGDYDYPPYEFLDENGQPTGFNVDLTRAIAREMGMQVEVRLGPWVEIKEALANGEIDAIQGMFYTPQRDETYNFSVPHTIVNHVIVTRTGAAEPGTLADLAGKSIIVMAGDLMQEVAVAQGYREHLVVVETQEAALRLLAEGRHDCALLAKLPALYQIERHGWHNLRISGKAVHSAEYCYAVVRDRALLQRLAAGLSGVINSGEYRRISEKWLGVYEETGLWAVLRQAAMIILPLLALLAGALLWSRLLQRKVAERTAELRAEMAERARVEADLRRLTADLEHQVREKSAQIVMQGRSTLLGRMAGGIAHDINNPVAIAGGNLELLEGFVRTLVAAVPPERCGEPAVRLAADEAPRAITTASRALVRVTETCRRLRTFFRPREADLAAFDLVEAVRTAVVITRDTWKHKCPEIVPAFSCPQPCTVRGSENDITQVLANIIVNAAQAIARTGTIGLRVMATADRVVTEIDDDGAGIPPEILERLGSESVTTKPPGEGTGLGLQIGFEIVRNHGGSITIASTPGAGTTVRITLPRRDETREDTKHA